MSGFQETPLRRAQAEDFLPPNASGSAEKIKNLKEKYNRLYDEQFQRKNPSQRQKHHRNSSNEGIFPQNEVKRSPSNTNQAFETLNQRLISLNPRSKFPSSSSLKNESKSTLQQRIEITSFKGRPMDFMSKPKRYQGLKGFEPKKPGISSLIQVLKEKEKSFERKQEPKRQITTDFLIGDSAGPVQEAPETQNKPKKLSEFFHSNSRSKSPENETETRFTNGLDDFLNRPKWRDHFQRSSTGTNIPSEENSFHVSLKLNEKKRDFDTISILLKNNKDQTKSFEPLLEEANLKVIMEKCQHLKTSKSPQKGEFRYADGGFYIGELVQGRVRDGHGQMSMGNGGMYVGDWSKDHMHGSGTLYYDSGKVAYRGGFVMNEFTGEGEMFNESPEDQKDFDYRDFSAAKSNWVSYKGWMKKDKKHGIGTLVLLDGTKYYGEFKRDFPDGFGIVYDGMDNVLASGIWKDGRFMDAF